MNKQLITTNLQTLLAAVEAQPEQNFNLTRYKDEDSACGTLFCTAGLAATLPTFQEQGLSLVEVDSFSRRKRYMVLVNGYDVDETYDTDAIFGSDAWSNLFATFGHGCRDDGFITKDENGDSIQTHKELAILRIKAQLAAVEAA